MGTEVGSMEIECWTLVNGFRIPGSRWDVSENGAGGCILLGPRNGADVKLPYETAASNEQLGEVKKLKSGVSS